MGEQESEATESPTKKIPAFIQYSPSNVPLYVLGTVLAVTAGASALTLIVTAADPTSAGLTMAALFAAVAVAAGWALSSWHPPVIAIRDGVLDVSSRRREMKFDLRDPETRVELSGKPGSPSWRAEVGPAKGRNVVIRAQQVKARQFTEIVEHHRRYLRDPDEESEEESSKDG